MRFESRFCFGLVHFLRFREQACFVPCVQVARLFTAFCDMLSLCASSKSGFMMTENPNANQGSQRRPGAPLFLIHNTTNIRFSAHRKKKCEALSPPTAVDARTHLVHRGAQRFEYLLSEPRFGLDAPCDRRDAANVIFLNVSFHCPKPKSFVSM